jgi:hypothetical protein
MIGEGKYPESICEELLGYCLAPVCQMGGLGGDNMSIIIICLLHGKPFENLVERCKKIHADKKAATKLSEPAFSQFDRFTADGPFAEVSVLKAADDVHSTGDSTSSSSHTSSPSSSPISTDEKFEAMLVEGAEKTQELPEKEGEEPKVKIEVTPAETAEASEASTKEKNADEKSKKPKEVAVSEPSKDPIVSNGE